jgi:hypothetical protein
LSDSDVGGEWTSVYHRLTWAKLKHLRQCVPFPLCWAWDHRPYTIILPRSLGSVSWSPAGGLRANKTGPGISR